MKSWQSVLLAMLLMMMPIFSACDLIGLGDSRAQQEREHYERQLEAYKKVQEANRKQQEAYNQQLQQGLQEWAKAYKEWQELRQQQQAEQLEHLEGMSTDNQS